MRIKLGTKIGLTYLLIIFTVMLVFGYLIMHDIDQSFISERKNVLLGYANIIAERAAPYLPRQDAAYLNYLAEDFGESIGHRVLIFATDGTVLGDSSGLNQGQVLTVPVVASALQGESVSQTNYYPDFGRLLYLAVPVAAGKQIVGAIFISADINDIDRRLAQTRNRLFLAATGSAVVAFLLSLLLARIITVPVARLTRAATKMSAGDYGYQVKGSSRDELGQLAASFNEMSKKIQQEDKVRRQFIADASHELRSPVAALKVLVESLLLKPPESKEETLEFLTDINGQLDRLSKLVNDLLLLSKIEKNESSLKKEPVSIKQLLIEVKENLKPLAAAKQIEITITAGDNILWPVDRDMLYRAVYNLVDNAIKYSSAKSEVLLSSTANEENLTISVKDQGIGIAQEHLAKLFTRFYRVDKARERATGGIGLGLSIVQEIVNLHGGRVSVNSAPGCGTEFVISLPYN
ncbi:MAG TPA: cell wall metabolism sensor histidine kinase WalK [Peptococcaceae bacterium]|nr:cell wall metabolism sensor histidine kinase WalK [Peptococcaceae bacterium]